MIPAPAGWFVLPWLARFAQPGELNQLLAAAGWPARLRLTAARPGYAYLERRAFGPGPDIRRPATADTSS
jgi:hypothetical protein